jgi:hypothetical protein
LQKHKDVEVFRPNRGVFGVLEDSVSELDFKSEFVINFKKRKSQKQWTQQTTNKGKNITYFLV